MRMLQFIISIVFVFSSYISFAETYTGKVVPLIKSTINSGTDADFNGVLQYVASVGDILKPEVTDMKGNVVEKGAPVFVLNTKYWEGFAEAAQANIQTAEADAMYAKENFKRYKKLAETHAVSTKTFQQSIDEFDKTRYTINANRAAVIQANEFVKACNFMAPFECVVDQVLLPGGMAAGQPPTIVISQLNPIGVKVKMSRTGANKINAETSISIYPMKSNEPIGIISGNNILTDDGIIFRVFNTPEYSDQISVEGKSIPVVKHIDVVQPFSVNNKNLLGLPDKAIFKDNNGTYVWHAKGIKHMQPGRGIKTLFPVEKVYVSPENMKKVIASNTQIRAFQKNDKLQLFDVILTEKIPSGLKNGDSVYFTQERYRLMPGDIVRVNID